jgi:hypothetical protein
MSVALRHPITGEIRVQEEGWSWSCFFGAGFLGLPLFRRGLQVWGAAMLVFDVSAFIVGWINTASGQNLYAWMSGIGFAASFFFGFRANSMAVDRALSDGWEFADKGRDWFN